jgi:hypothetical protein
VDTLFDLAPAAPVVDEQPALFPADQAAAYLIGGRRQPTGHYADQQLTMPGMTADAAQGALFTN